MEGLRDIRGLVEIPSYNGYILWAIFTILLSIIALYLIAKFRKKQVYSYEIPSQKELAFKALKELNFSDTKEIVYTFTQNFAYFDDSDEVREFVKSLEIYKYKKDTPNLKSSDREYIKNFIDRISL